MCSRLNQRARVEGSAHGAPESGSSVSGVMGFLAVGTSTRPRPSNTRDSRRSTLHASPSTRETSHHPPNHRTRTIRWSETTGAASVRSSRFRPTDEPTAVSHPTPAPTRTSRSFLKRRWVILAIRFGPSANAFSSFLPPFLHIRQRYGYIGMRTMVAHVLGSGIIGLHIITPDMYYYSCNHGLNHGFQPGPRDRDSVCN